MFIVTGPIPSRRKNKGRLFMRTATRGLFSTACGGKRPIPISASLQRRCCNPALLLQRDCGQEFTGPHRCRGNGKTARLEMCIRDRANVVLTSLILFTFIYFLLFAVFIYLLNDKIQHGPHEDDLIPAGKLALPDELTHHEKS